MLKPDANRFNKSVYFTDVVKSQIEDLEIDETVTADLFGKSKRKFRMTLKYVEGLKRFKTKSNWDGDLYIMRVR
tara:strand:+ start:2440 stop:2661 length:222 start_codon:yes stop_codon:yes gene_type:complete